jgi:hypothetical protein
VGGEAAAAVSWAQARWRWPLSEEVGAVRMRLARGSDRAADGWAPAVSLLSRIIQTGSNLVIEKECLTFSKNSQISYAIILGHYEQFTQLYGHPIPNRIRVKNHGTNLPFESLRNF